MLRRRLLGKGQNGHEVAFMAQVRNGTGFVRAERTIDAVAMSLWPSRGLTLNGYEVKCSRKDWLSELRSPEKAEAHARYLDHFYVVTAENVVADAEEVLATWGWYCAAGSRLTCLKPAPDLSPEPVDRVHLAGLLRSACYVGGALPEEVTVAAAQGRADGEAAGKRQLERAEKQLRELRAEVRAFEEASGVSLHTWRDGGVESIGAAVRAVLDGSANVAEHERRLAQLLTSATRIHRGLAQELGELDADARS